MDEAELVQLGLKAGAAGVQYLVRKHAEMLAKADADWVNSVTQEQAQIGAAVAITWLAVCMKKPVTDQAVQDFLAEIASGSGMARLHRLLTEARNSPSKARRYRLAAIAYGGPKAVPEPDQLDRLDMLAAQLLDGDVTQLQQLKELANGASPENVEGWNRALIVIHPNGDQLHVNGSRVPRDPAAFAFDPFNVPINRLAVTTLESVGCIRLSPHFQMRSSIYGRALEVTPLGTFLLDALAREPIASALRDSAPIPDAARMP